MCVGTTFAWKVRRPAAAGGARLSPGDRGRGLGSLPHTEPGGPPILLPLAQSRTQNIRVCSSQALTLRQPSPPALLGPQPAGGSRFLVVDLSVHLSILLHTYQFYFSREP